MYLIKKKSLNLRKLVADNNVEKDRGDGVKGFGGQWW